MHKMKEGDIDGLTLIYGGDCLEWKPLSTIPVLNDAMMKIATEEESKRLAFIQSQNEVETKQQIFVDGDNHIHPFPIEMMNYGKALASASIVGNNSNSSMIANSSKKSFVADNGISYVWDDVENDWVEADDDDDVDDVNDNDDDAVQAKELKLPSNKRTHDLDEDDENDDNTTTNPSNNGIITKDDEDGSKDNSKEKKKRRNKKKHKKLPNTWVYVTGLPSDVSVEEIKDHFSKVGLIALSPYDQQAKIKIYREENSVDDVFNGDVRNAGSENLPCKGDCSICYNAEESVQLAIDILNGGYIRVGYQVNVSRANFAVQAINDSNNSIMAMDSKVASSGSTHINGSNMHKKKQDRPFLSQAQVKVAKSAIKQALTWNEDDDIGVSKSSALRIVVLQGLFRPQDFIDNINFSDELEEDIASECSKCGNIEKITVFSTNPKGIVIVKFSTSFAAQECIKLMNGRYFGGNRIKCYFWDGVTNYSVVIKSDQQEDEEEKQEENRLDEFGDWLEQNQEELPEEFMLRTE